MALLSVAIYDATIAAWDSKYVWNREHPSAADPGIQPLVNVAGSPSYPSEHAVAAGAASAVLAYLLPNMGEIYTDLAEEAARSRLYAGAAYPSDVSAGLQLGRQVAAAAIARAQADGSAVPFMGSFPAVPGRWSSATPVTPLAGTLDAVGARFGAGLQAARATRRRLAGKQRAGRGGEELRSH